MFPYLESMKLKEKITKLRINLQSRSEYIQLVSVKLKVGDADHENLILATSETCVICFQELPLSVITMNQCTTYTS